MVSCIMTTVVGSKGGLFEIGYRSYQILCEILYVRCLVLNQCLYGPCMGTGGKISYDYMELIHCPCKLFMKVNDVF